MLKWSKTFGLLATFTLDVVPFCAYAQLPVLLPFCLDQLNFVKIAAFLQLGKLKKVG
jgi:hypothetical protein